MRYNNTVIKFLGKRYTSIIQDYHSVEHALDVMEKEDTDALGVQSHGHLIGIFTRSDFMRRVLCRGMDSRKVLVSDVMTCSPIVIGPYIRLKDAYNIMLDNRISHLPVLSPDDNTFLGIISEEDLRYDVNIFMEETENENRMLMRYINGEDYAVGAKY